jgi:hypothetical protein
MKTMGTALIIASLGLTACSNKVQFNAANLASSQSDQIVPVVDGNPPTTASPTPTPSPSPSPTPVVDPTPTPSPSPSPSPTPTPPPIVIPTPVPTPQPVYNTTQGACANDSSTSVNSCLKCQVPVAAPTLSHKAEQLIQIMTLACPLNNKAFGNKYTTPTLANNYAKMYRCSPSKYPDSVPDAGQQNVVTKLLAGDATLMNKMFTGLWYQPPYSDYFETYFGMEVGEAIQAFCMQDFSHVLGRPLLPSMTGPNPYGPVYRMGDNLPYMYQLGNVYRNGLESCISDKINPPGPVPQIPAPSPTSGVSQSCSFQTLSGEAGDKINQQVASWLSAGYKVGIDVQNQGVCSVVTSVDAIKSYTGVVTVGAYICK